jgi:hypothetical protein
LSNKHDLFEATCFIIKLSESDVQYDAGISKVLGSIEIATPELFVKELT